jgi:hypothetical protein
MWFVNPHLRSEMWGTRFCAYTVEGDEEGVDGEGHPETDKNVGDEEACVEEGANTGGECQRGVEGAAVGMGGGRDSGEEAKAEGVDGEQQS